MHCCVCLSKSYFIVIVHYSNLNFHFDIFVTVISFELIFVEFLCNSSCNVFLYIVVVVLHIVCLLYNILPFLHSIAKFLITMHSDILFAILLYVHFHSVFFLLCVFLRASLSLFLFERIPIYFSVSLLGEHSVYSLSIFFFKYIAIFLFYKSSFSAVEYSITLDHFEVHSYNVLQQFALKFMHFLATYYFVSSVHFSGNILMKKKLGLYFFHHSHNNMTPQHFTTITAKQKQ